MVNGTKLNWVQVNKKLCPFQYFNCVKIFKFLFTHTSKSCLKELKFLLDVAADFYDLMYVKGKLDYYITAKLLLLYYAVVLSLSVYGQNGFSVTMRKMSLSVWNISSLYYIKCTSCYILKLKKHSCTWLDIV